MQSVAEQMDSCRQIQQMLSENRLPKVFDLEGEGLENCARTFSLDNNIPFERLNLCVFETLAKLQNVSDLVRSPLFCSSAKTGAIECLHKAKKTASVRTFSTQSILEQLVRPSKDEAESPLARLDLRDLGLETPWKTMGEHPFHSRCVSTRFLSFWIAPGGELRFLCDLHDPVS